MRATINEATIPDNGEEVELWFVWGIPKRLYPTKIVAEAAARETFPDESEGERYGRIFYRRFMRSE